MKFKLEEDFDDDDMEYTDDFESEIKGSSEVVELLKAINSKLDILIGNKGESPLSDLGKVQFVESVQQPNPFGGDIRDMMFDGQTSASLGGVGASQTMQGSPMGMASPFAGIQMIDPDIPALKENI